MRFSLFTTGVFIIISFISIFFIKNTNVFAKKFTQIKNNTTATNDTILIKYDNLRWQTEYKNIEDAKKNPEKVFVLNLADKELNEFPKEILNFKNLQKLVLFGNKIKSLPKEINQLEKLQFLDLYNNQISDLPAEFCDLINLQYIDLGNNRLSKLPANFSNLKKIKCLFLYGNSFSDYPNEISNLKDLTELRLGKGLKIMSKGNTIREIPASISQNTQLIELHLSDLPLKNLPNEISQLKNLKYLDLTHTRLKKIPTPIYGMTQLENVRFWDNGFKKNDKEKLQKSLPNTKIHYEEHYDGNFWALGLGVQQSNFTALELSILSGFRKDIIAFYTGIGGNISTDGTYKTAKIMAGANGLGFLATNLQFLHAWQNDKTGFGICPEIGIGWNWLSLTYGYTFGFGKNIDNFNQHSIQLRYVLRVF